MNYLVLTPDGVGSTILQSVLTMALYLENQDVMNTHEIANGIKLHNNVAVEHFFDERYSQNLNEISQILLSSQKQTALVSRLAKYHLDSRKDSVNDCQYFYKFLNDFYGKIIMCVRDNIFEYAMSWSIRRRSGVLNVYNKEDRDKVSQVSEVDEDFFVSKCQDYVQYVDWIENNFPHVEKVSYESMIKRSDQIVQEITGYQNTFLDNFGVPLSMILSNEYEFLKNRGDNKLSNVHAKALTKYKTLSDKLSNEKIVFGVPLKNTTLSDKKKQIKNFDACLKRFSVFARNHNWIDQSKSAYDFWNEEYVC